MNNPKFISFAESEIDFIDGDRGTNYPSKSELIANGYCVFLNTGNVKKTGFDFTRVEFIDEEKDKKLRKGKVRQGDIVLTTRGTVGNVALVTSDTPFKNIRINSGMVIVRTDPEKYDPYFILLFFRSSLFQKQCLSHGSGSAQPQLPISALKYISFPNIDIDHQRKVVSAASCIDKKIELNNRINAELESIAKILYDYWFVQFDFPDDSPQGKPYKTTGGKMVYNPTLKREIPEEWGDSTIGSIEPNIVTGKTPSKDNPEYFGGNVPFITIGDIRGNTYIVSTEETLTDSGAATQKNKFLPEDSICVTCIASPGLVGFVTTPAQTNQQINSVVCSNDINKYYLYFAIKSYFEGANAKTGNTFSNMNKGDFSTIGILKPSDQVLQDYHQKAYPLFEQIKLKLLENKKLVKLRDWLLPMLMNGQVTIK
ncbi:restriction endonuclease subunit S [Shewanella sp. SM32]|uniref:restriction endonuclease subunit S n=1 Tax=Shewanella sp. SM32 TaxID=2912796 RepID=UPI0021D91DC1|nr:restriction endonuclease subunit S [Shewanella sp. SM32]MCU8072003.1 restriction endonuclease subunit S [Shewanella sp. SM32]